MPRLSKKTMFAIEAVLDQYRPQGIAFHAARAGARRRDARSRRCMCWCRAHGRCSALTTRWRKSVRIRQAVGEATVFTHLEPREDPASYRDLQLDRHP